MGADGGGKLTVDMWTSKDDTSARTFTMDLSNVGSSSYALYGNLSISGSDSGSIFDYSNKTFNGKFGGKGIRGGIDIDAKGISNLTFTGEAQLSRIWARKGANKFIFEKEAIIKSGSEVIYTGFYQDNQNQAQNTFVFKKNAIIEHSSGKDQIAISVYATSGSTKENTFNDMTFQGEENRIVGKIITQVLGNDEPKTSSANILKFTSTNGVNILNQQK